MNQIIEKLSLPLVKKITLDKFSLYAKKDQLTLNFNNGVFCLAGANGLGKSTFLNIINFALTGCVISSSHRFKSIPAFYKHGKSFASKFFEGRISEHDREKAKVTIEFDLGNSYSYRVTRNFFDTDSLLQFEKKSKKNGLAKNLVSEKNPQRLLNLYNQHIARDVGLEDIDQLLFLQYFVFTFDEARHLLFWNQPVLERIMYLIFGFDSEKAKQIDKLSTQIDKYNSDGRNAKWDSKQVEKKIAELKSSVSISNDAKANQVYEEYISLEETLKSVESEIKEKQEVIADCDLKISDFTSRISKFRVQYSALFDQYYSKSSEIALHPIIKESISSGSCKLCGTTNNDVVASIKEIIHRSICPICNSELKKTKQGDHELINKISNIDKLISKLNDNLESEFMRRERIDKEVQESKIQLAKAKNRIEKHEQSYLSTIEQLKNNKDYQSVLAMYEKQRDDYLEKRDRDYKKRDELIKQKKYSKKI